MTLILANLNKLVYCGGKQLISMIEYTKCNVERVAVHQIGNKTNGEDIRLSKLSLDTSDSRLREILLKFFLEHFKNPEIFNFSFSNGDYTLNPIFIFSSSIFDKAKSFHANSINFAKHLYELSTHPQIKSGDLFVVYFKDLGLDGELLNAIGIFKSENKQDYLKLDTTEENFILHYENGINIEKMDKGCLIFNTSRENGYKVLIVDKSNKGAEAQYWKDEFLKIQPSNDNYHSTQHYMDACKIFVSNQLEQEYEVEKTDKISYLNKTVEYFKKNEAFDENEFLETVFEDKEVIKSFTKYKEEYLLDTGIELENSFEISSTAVKKQARVFKSVLKLDKNFHVYIHGDKSLIEKGFDAKLGKSFYKIYFDEET